jgi:hypothetical protein
MTTPPPTLSQAAQAIQDAYKSGGLSAVLIAIADLDEIKPEFIGPCDQSYGDYLQMKPISQRDFRYELALHKSKVQVAAEWRLLAIATELRQEVW